jgi:hypothetical protein
MALRDVLLKMLRDDNLTVEEAGPVLRLGFTGKNGRFVMALRVDETRQQFAAFALCPIEAGERLDAVSELVHRLNQDLVTVAFDLDVERGLVRCRGGIDVEGVTPTPALLSPVLYAVAAAMDQALPAITAVVVKQLEPHRAMAAIV